MDVLAEKEMNIDFEIRDLLTKLSPFLTDLQIDIAQEFIDKGELGISLEFVSDIIREQVGVILSEENAKSIREIAEFLHLDPKRTWLAIPFRNEKTGIAERLLPDDIVDVYPEIYAIAEACAGRLPQNDLMFIVELLDHNECQIALETFRDCLIEEEISIPREIFDRLMAVVGNDVDSDTYKSIRIDDGAR